MMTDTLIARSIVAGQSHESYDLTARGIGTPHGFYGSDVIAQQFDRGLDAADMWRAFISAGIPRSWLLAHLDRAVTQVPTRGPVGWITPVPVLAAIQRARALIEAESVAASLPPLREGTLVYLGDTPWVAPDAALVEATLAEHQRLRVAGGAGLPQVGPDGLLLAVPVVVSTPETDVLVPNAVETPTLPNPVTEAARIAHEVNRAYCQALGDDSQPSWEDAPNWQLESAITGVQFHLDNPTAGPEASHMAWLRQKHADGWTYGPVKDSAAKTHPCYVPFHELPREQQAKDYLFRAVVHAVLRPAREGPRRLDVPERR